MHAQGQPGGVQRASQGIFSRVVKSIGLYIYNTYKRPIQIWQIHMQIQYICTHMRNSHMQMGSVKPSGGIGDGETATMGIEAELRT